MILAKVPPELQELRNRMNEIANEIANVASELNREYYGIPSSGNYTTWSGTPRGNCFERQERKEKRDLLSRLNAQWDSLRNEERKMMARMSADAHAA